MERLQKIIAAAGVASRRAAEQLIKEGRVTVNGAVVTRLGSQADPVADAITVNGQRLPQTAKAVTYLVHKPRGVVCSRKRQAGERIVTDLLPSQPPVYPIGRLDKESEGLILVSNDGALTHRLNHPSFQHEKEYLVTAAWEENAKPLTGDQISHKLQKGVKLGDGDASATQVSVREAPEGVIIRLTVREGRHHLVRRMCATLGLRVRSLVRVRVASLTLSHLSAGTYRRLSPTEVRKLYAA